MGIHMYIHKYISECEGSVYYTQYEVAMCMRCQGRGVEGHGKQEKGGRFVKHLYGNSQHSEEPAALPYMEPHTLPLSVVCVC